MNNQDPFSAQAAAPIPAGPVRPAETGEEIEIDLVELFYVLWEHIWHILLFLIIGIDLAFIVTYFFITPQYKATSKLYVITAKAEEEVSMTDLQIAANLTNDYMQLLQSRPLLEDVIESLDLDMTYDGFRNMLSINNPDGTRILNLTITSSSPELSYVLANELAEKSTVYLANVVEGAGPNVYEHAIMPEKPSSPSFVRNCLIGGLLLAMIYCAILIIRHLMNDTYTSADDIRKYLGIEPLAAIPEGAGSGSRKKRRRSRIKAARK